jgi:hypothetical protein
LNFKRQIRLLEIILVSWQMQIKALQIIFKKYPIASKVVIVKTYLKHACKKTIEEIADDLGIEEEKTFIVNHCIKGKSILCQSVSGEIPFISMRRFSDKVFNKIIELI